MRSLKNAAWDGIYDLSQEPESRTPYDEENKEGLSDGSDQFLSEALEDAHEALSKLYNKTHKRDKLPCKFKPKEAW